MICRYDILDGEKIIYEGLTSKQVEEKIGLSSRSVSIYADRGSKASSRYTIRKNKIAKNNQIEKKFKKLYGEENYAAWLFLNQKYGGGANGTQIS